MNLSKNKEKKISKKILRCQSILKTEIGIEFSEQPTQFVCILNSGLSTGLNLEKLLEEIISHDASVQEISMVPGKSYCFVSFSSKADAIKALEAMNAVSALGQDGAVLYLTYCVAIPKINNPWANAAPPGLIIIKDFITDLEESQLIKEVGICDSEQTNAQLKHRVVKHFGYEFIYGSNNVDPKQPLDQKIPCIFEEVIYKRLHSEQPQFSWFVPDQMTVNKYEPSQGIPHHVDTHSPFEDPIMSLSLLDDTVMEFKRDNHVVWIYLPRRSLLIMSGESRYGWTHAITARQTDVIQTANGLSMQKRGTRISCTFRKLRTGPCTCLFPQLCDSQKQELLKQPSSLEDCDTELAAKLEKQNVHDVYEEIAAHFSETRHSPWPKVIDFLKSFEPGDILLDIGCGNGKYLNANFEIQTIGCDRSEGLLKVCQEKSYNVFQCDCLAVPFVDESINGCISIAVIHHVVSEDRRRKAIQEMARILKSGGRGLIYVWSKNQEADSKKSSYLRQNKENNRKLETKLKDKKTPENNEDGIQLECLEKSVVLPVHTNRTQFKHKDLLVPWKLKEKSSEPQALQSKIFLRYYHVFDEGELESLCQTVKQIKVIKNYYDQGNWCVIFEKI